MSRTALAWLLNLALLIVGGAVSLFIGFLFAYGFSESTISAGQHVFLVGWLLVSAVLGGLLLGLLDAAVLGVKIPVGLQFGVLTSLAAHLTALAGGTLISLANESQNSVTADQPNAPFVGVVVLSLILAAAAARGAVQVARPTGVRS